MQIRPYHFHKFNGASGYGFAGAARQGVSVNLVAHCGWNSEERYFREGMLALPYGWFGYALYQHIISCKYSANGFHNYMAHGG